MAEFWGNNQPMALPTGHRPPCQVDENLVVVTPDQDWGRRRLGTGCGSAPFGISEAPALAREGEWEGKPVRPRQPRPSLGRGGCRQYLYSGRRGLNPPSVQLWVNQSCA